MHFRFPDQYFAVPPSERQARSSTWAPLQELSTLAPDQETSQFSLMTDTVMKTSSIPELSQALQSHSGLHLQDVQSTGLAGENSYRKRLRRIAAASTKSEIEVLAAITRLNMSRDGADHLLGVLANVSSACSLMSL